MPLPAVTVVIPAFAAAERVGTAIGSVLAQPGIRPSVVVVVDDGSAETVAAASGFGPAVTVIVNERNLGPAASRNAGLARVTTPFAMFLDSDDWVEGRLLAGLAEALDRSGADLAFGTFVNLHEATGRREPAPPPAALSETDLFERWLVGTSYVPPCAVLWRTQAVRDLGGWDTAIRRGDDAELACRALLRGCRFTTSSEGAGIYLYHEGPHRVSRQTSRCGDLKAAIDKLVALPDAVLPRDGVERAAAQAYYEVARIAYLAGDEATGDAALQGARRLGFAGHRGGPGARLLGRAIGLRNRLRLRALFGAG